MLQKNNEYKVLRIFLNSPMTEFGLREISREIGLALPSVKRYLLDLEKDGVIDIRDRKGVPVYVARMDSERFRFYESLFMQYELFESGLIDYIWKKLCPEAIIFYGSHAKGEAIENSDIDLFVVGKRSKVSQGLGFSDINLDKYEKILRKGVHLMNDEVGNIPKELKNNLANGIVMRGYLKILK